ncbi:MAG: sensor histidine kinase, partial [Myxococcaceae bacterium]
WDADRLAQVVANLVLNAVKYGDRDHPIHVRAWDEEGEQMMTVHNRGEPIPPSLLPHVFEPFRRGAFRQNAERRGGGMGLGLYIVRETVRAHGGSIQVISSEHEGTRFTVRLPRQHRS